MRNHALKLTSLIAMHCGNDSRTAATAADDDDPPHA